MSTTFEKDYTKITSADLVELSSQGDNKADAYLKAQLEAIKIGPITPQYHNSLVKQATSHSIELGAYLIDQFIFSEGLLHVIKSLLKEKNCLVADNGRQAKKLNAARAVKAQLEHEVDALHTSVMSQKQKIVLLQSKLAAHSPESLLNEIESLKDSVESKEYEVELLREEAQKAAASRNKLHATINDLDRHNRYLGTLLRQHGIPFNEVFGHGEGHDQEAA